MIGLNGIAIPSSTLDTLRAKVPFWAGGNFTTSSAILALLVVAVWMLPNSQQIVDVSLPAEKGNQRGPFVHAPMLVRMGLLDKQGHFALTAVSGFIIGSALLGAMILQSARSATLQPFIYFQF
jgi:hypothetical protein